MMIEQILLTYLKASIDVPVYTEKPSGVDTFVLIERTGGSETNHVYTATFAIQCWSDSMYKAADLNDSVRQAMSMAFAVPAISSAKLNSDYNYTDTTTKSYRYQSVYDVVYC